MKNFEFFLKFEGHELIGYENDLLWITEERWIYLSRTGLLILTATEVFWIEWSLMLRIIRKFLWMLVTS